MLNFEWYIIKNIFIKFIRKPFVYISHYKNINYKPKDEFHKSLDIDGEYMSYLTKEQREKYLINLMHRRNIAHEKDL